MCRKRWHEVSCCDKDDAEGRARWRCMIRWREQPKVKRRSRKVVTTPWQKASKAKVTTGLTSLMEYNDLWPVCSQQWRSILTQTESQFAHNRILPWRKSESGPRVAVFYHVNPSALQSLWLSGWRKQMWCLMVIWLTGNPFVSGVIWLPAEVTWALEDRKAISLALCLILGSFLWMCPHHIPVWSLKFTQNNSIMLSCFRDFWWTDSWWIMHQLTKSDDWHYLSAWVFA